MEYKTLGEADIELMERFIDDENTHYDKEKVIEFIKDKNAYGFIIKKKRDNRICLWLCVVKTRWNKRFLYACC